MTILDAVITDGPNKGFTLAETIALGLVLTGNTEVDTARAREARAHLAKIAKKAK